MIQKPHRRTAAMAARLSTFGAKFRSAFRRFCELARLHPMAVRGTLVASLTILWFSLPLNIRLTAQELTTRPAPSDTNPSATSTTANSPRADIILVRGADGTSEYGAMFDEWLARWQEAGKRWNGNIHRIGAKEGKETPSASSGPSLNGSNTARDQLLQLLEQLPKDGEQTLWMVFVGHGTYASSPVPTARFNLIGPDVSADDLAKVLKPYKRPLVIVNSSSCSGAFIAPLSGSNRILLTATRSGNEQSFARFGDYLASALHDASSDRDHDGAVSLTEAFLTASGQVERFYKDEGRLASEHALLEDNGDGQGVTLTAFAGVRPKEKTSRDGRAIDGLSAHGVQVLEVEPQPPLSSEQVRRRNELEEAIRTLRDSKDSMQAEAYYKQLEQLLLELARLLTPPDANAS